MKSGTRAALAFMSIFKIKDQVQIKRSTFEQLLVGFKIVRRTEQNSIRDAQKAGDRRRV